MGMFIVKKGTKGYKIIYKSLGYEQQKYIAKKDMCFGKEELEIDPTGISRYAAIPVHVKTIGGYWAEQGYYGFKNKQGLYLFGASKVIYG